MPTPTFEIQGRSTGKGAFTDARIIEPAGSERQPDRTECSGSGNHWTSWWYQPVDDCLILVTDISNSGKDTSYVHQVPAVFTLDQEKGLAEFKAEHWLD